MERFNRAVRRHHVKRLKRNRRTYWGYEIVGENQMSEKRLGQIVTTPHVCSCMGCGNGRRYFGEHVKFQALLDLWKTEE